MYGHRIAGEKLSVRIERESEGEVTRRDLRPDDWMEIWPELERSIAEGQTVSEVPEMGING